MTKVAIFDTETTGLIKNSHLPLEKQPCVIEFYGEIVDDETGEVLEELEFLANPGFPLEAIITQITKLTDADLEPHPRFKVNAPRVVEFFSKADEAVAHNLQYDKGMIGFEMARAELELKWPAKMTCTVQRTEHIKGHRLNLSKLHEHLFGEAFEGAHRAREDVKALARCFLELRKQGEI